jgi:putative hydrolase of the HAD superfamily
LKNRQLFTGIKVIAFDADDTLWINEPYFRQIEERFCELMQEFATHHTVSQDLLKTEISNLSLYGYGVKGFTLSMIETALSLSNNSIPGEVICRILDFGKDLLAHPVELIDGIEQVLAQLKGNYRLVVATKGDLLNQEEKLKKSGIEQHFHHVEIMSEKNEAGYLKLIRHLDISPDAFLMIGNSLKSDVLPVLAIGGHAIHIPFHTTWAHENIDHIITHENFHHFEKASDILPYL